MKPAINGLAGNIIQIVMKITGDAHFPLSRLLLI